MLVSQLMRKNFPTVLPSDSIQDAARKMREKKAGVALVLEDDEIRGILTEMEINTAIANSETGSAVLKGDTKDDGNRCCYFNDVSIDLLNAK